MESWIRGIRNLHLAGHADSSSSLRLESCRFSLELAEQGDWLGIGGLQRLSEGQLVDLRPGFVNVVSECG